MGCFLTGKLQVLVQISGFHPGLILPLLGSIYINIKIVFTEKKKLPPGDIQQCLEKLLVVTHGQGQGREGASRILWVETKDAASMSCGAEQPLRVTQPLKSTALMLTKPSLETSPFRFLLEGSQVRQFPGSFLGNDGLPVAPLGTTPRAVELHLRTATGGLPAVSFRNRHCLVH